MRFESLLKCLILSFSVVTVSQDSAAETTAPRPNILWISCEDTSPNLPMYGDNTVATPNLSALASDGCVYDNAFATSPVCSPSRSTIITGKFAASLGTQRHRGRVPLPPEIRCFSAYLRDAGYYCTNNSKTDYNFDVPQDAWDECNNKAHWRNRPDPKQPFFAVFNFITTHEHVYFINDKQFNDLTKDVETTAKAEAKNIKLPPYIPDTPTTRNDWVRMYNAIVEMDYQSGQILKELEEDGLSSNTIVVFFSDHGRGLPRGKRWLYDSGLQVPFIVRWPGHVTPGTREKEFVSLIDLGPTMLNLVGIDVPKYMQGRIFLGDNKQPEPKYLYATRDRLDEGIDMSRSVRDHQYKYIHNFHPEEPNLQVMEYLERNPTIKELRRLQAAGEITGPASWFFADHKPVEELYDIQADPWEIHNLADQPDQAKRLNEMRNALTEWQIKIGDTGFDPEPMKYVFGPQRKQLRALKKNTE